jgi:hypothetical protein
VPSLLLAHAFSFGKPHKVAIESLLAKICFFPEPLFLLGGFSRNPSLARNQKI